MQVELRQELEKMDDVGFRELKHNIEIADLIRTNMRKYNKPAEFVIAHLRYESRHIDRLLNGAVNIDLRLISEIEVMIQSWVAEALIKTHPEAIHFPPYRHSAKPDGDKIDKDNPPVNEWCKSSDYKMPLEKMILVKHPNGIEAIQFFSAKWKYAYSGVPVDQPTLLAITDFLIPG